ncbi:MAG: hypothetical protein AAB037_05725 [Chloroflexota bacterium]
MPSDIASIAAATAVLDYDLLQAKRTAQSSRNRALVAVALAGSTATLDAAVEVFIDTVLIGRFFNTRANAPPNADDIIRVGPLGWPAGARLSAIVVDAPATNALNFRYDWVDL